MPLRTSIRSFIRKYIEPKALVLMYHRVAEPASDIWELAVSPANFEQHLQVLQQSGRVVPLEELAEGVRNKTLKRNAIAITFDDGYLDNYLAAKPLLEKYRLPATFFVTSGNVGQAKEFWWDELEHLLLFSDELPANISMDIGGATIAYNLGDEACLSEGLRQQHVSWNACTQAPPTLRSALFYNIWERLKPLHPKVQQEQLQKLRDWAGVNREARQDYISISEEQLLDLSKHGLFTVGAHTKSHVALASHSEELQEQELVENRNYLEKITGRQVNLLAYPYGNHNNTTVTIAERAAFEAAFTTEEEPVTKRSSLHRLGRFQVKNKAGKEFNQQLQSWKNSI